jgi:hypothetical protein
MARKKCRQTLKDRFSSELEANMTIADIHRSNSHNRHRRFREEPTRSYSCEFCGDWHITSQPKRSESQVRQ